MSGMKLWGGRFESGPSEVFEKYSWSLHFDKRLVEADTRGSQAFARALSRVGILTAEECARLEAAFATCLESLGHSHAKIKRVEFPPFDDVKDYIDLLGLRPTRPWWEQLEAVYGAIAAGSRDYRELADEIESLVEQLTKRGT